MFHDENIAETFKLYIYFKIIFEDVKAETIINY
jgi:hypothetical protein